MEGFYPREQREQQVENSKRYKGWLACMVKEIYPHYQPSMKTNSLAHCMLLLQGLHPMPDQRRVFHRSFAFKGDRSEDLLRRDDWIAWKATFHLSHPPGRAPKFGAKDWDELYKV